MKTPLETLKSLANELDNKFISPKTPQVIFLTNDEIHNLEDDFIEKGFNTAIRYGIPEDTGSLSSEDLKKVVSLTISICGYHFIIIESPYNSGDYAWHKKSNLNPTSSKEDWITKSIYKKYPNMIIKSETSATLFRISLYEDETKSDFIWRESGAVEEDMNIEDAIPEVIRRFKENIKKLLSQP